MILAMGTLMAQNVMPQGRDGRPMRGGMRPGQELVADTTITNHMNLTPEQQKEIDSINASYQEQMKEMMSKRSEDGKRLSREEREARMKQIAEQKKDARLKLRTVLGDDLYIEYLETSLDRMPAMMMGGGPRGGHGAHGGHGGHGGQGGHMGGGRMGGWDNGFGGSDF